ncbi:MAG: PD-(D/E)XK nuclease family protein [Anaerolineales bacterium]
MKLSTLHDFQLNQSNLQDFIDCPRRFQLKVLEGISWPAADSEPIEKFEQFTQLGNRFHLLCQQFFSTIAPNHIQDSIKDPVLLAMWENFLPYGQNLLKYRLYSEQLLTVPFHHYRLLAKFDLIVELSPTQYLIIDWKTSSKKPPRKNLEKRVQTFLYPYIFFLAGSDLFQDKSFQPDFIEMQYWYPLHEDHQEIFLYSKEKHNTVTSDLDRLVTEINSMIEGQNTFSLTSDLSNCQYCIFRSLCNRGTKAGPLDKTQVMEQDDLSNVYFDFEQIKEIEF